MPVLKRLYRGCSTIFKGPGKSERSSQVCMSMYTCMSSSQHFYLPKTKSRPKPLFISFEMPTALLSTFVHMAWSKNRSTTFQWWSYRPPVNETECVFTDQKSLRQKSDLLEAVTAMWHDVDCKRKMDCRVLTLFSCSM